MPTSVLAPLPENGSNTSTRAFQLYTYPSIHLSTWSPLLVIWQFHSMSTWNRLHLAIPSYLMATRSIPVSWPWFVLSPSLVERTNALHSPARIRGELLSPQHTLYEPKHPTVEAFPVLSDRKCESLVQPACRESWRRLDSVEGRVLPVLFPCLQGDPTLYSSAFIQEMCGHDLYI